MEENCFKKKSKADEGSIWTNFLQRLGCATKREE